MKLYNHPENQISLYIDSENPIGKKIKALAENEPNTSAFVKSYHDSLSATQIAEICERMELDPTELIDNRVIDEDSQKMNHEDIAWILKKQPSSLKHPIAIRGERIEFIKTSTDILKLTKTLKNKYDNTTRYSNA
jgi:arsenate reductase-like glutaredoxin family protein